MNSDTISITAIVTTDGPLAIHDGGDERTDQALRRDARGLPFLPGTSLAGALRAASRRVNGPTRTDEVFGTVDGDEAVPSAVTVLDAHLVDPRPIPSEVRPHVAIDRERGAARPGLLFDEEVWPHGLRFRLRLLTTDDALTDVIAALAALASPAGGIGSGPCPISVSDIATERLAPFGIAWIDAAERADDWPTSGERLEIPDHPASDRTGVRLRITLEATSPLLVSLPVVARGQGDHRDNLPFTVTRVTATGDVERAPAIPGSSLKGVLRQRAERHAHRANAAIEDPWDVVGDGHPIARAFGLAPTGREGAGRAGRLRFHDAVAVAAPFDGVSVWAAGDADEHPLVYDVERVSIDRLTGGTLGSGKFTDTVVTEGTVFEAVVDIVPDEGSAEVDPLDLALLFAGLRDLDAGLAGLGGRTRSGYGHVRIRSIAASDGGDRLGMPTDPVDPDEAVASVRQRVDEAWRTWLATQARDDQQEDGA